MRSGIGDTLRAARRAQGRTLSDAAEATRVRETYLAALEQEEFQALGGDVYARGFLRSYARYLHLDPEPLVDAYLGQLSGTDPPARGRAPRRRPPAGGRTPSGSAAARPARAPAARQARSPAASGGRAAQRPQPPQERPPGAAVLLLLVVVVLVAVAFAGLRGGEGGAALRGGEGGAAAGVEVDVR